MGKSGKIQLKNRVFTWELPLEEFHVKIFSDQHGLGYMPICEQIDAEQGTSITLNPFYTFTPQTLLLKLYSDDMSKWRGVQFSNKSGYSLHQTESFYAE